MPYVYSRPYAYSFLQIFQALRLFPALRLFRTLEYIIIGEYYAILVIVLSNVLICTQVFISRRKVEFHPTIKVIHPKYYKDLKKGANKSHLGRQKTGWFLAD